MLICSLHIVSVTVFLISLGRIFTVIKTHLKSAQKCREIAAYLASRFITRPDLKDRYLPQFITYSFQVSFVLREFITYIAGVQTVICAVFHSVAVSRSFSQTQSIFSQI